MAEMRFPAMAALVAALALLSCGGDTFDSECDLVVVNDSACHVSISVDGRAAFAVRAGSDQSAADIGAGRHVLEAVDAQGRLVTRETIELATGEDYYWIIHDC